MIFVKKIKVRKPLKTKAYTLLGIGGDRGTRTLDLCVANASLSQLSYAPTCI